MIGRSTNPLLWAAASLILLFLFMPVLVTLPVSFTDNSYLSFPTDELVVRHYEAVFADPQWLASTAQKRFRGIRVGRRLPRCSAVFVLSRAGS